MQIGHHCAWSFTTYGLLGLPASTGEIVGTVGVAFRMYMTEATATNPRTSKATARRIFLIINAPLLSSVFYLSCTAQRAKAGSSVWLTARRSPAAPSSEASSNAKPSRGADGCSALLDSTPAH